jgi:hypothetical protein
VRLLISTLVIVFYCVSCRDEAEQPPNQLDKLKGTWILTEAIDGTDRTGNLPDLKLTVSDTFKEDGISFTALRVRARSKSMAREWYLEIWTK